MDREVECRRADGTIIDKWEISYGPARLTEKEDAYIKGIIDQMRAGMAPSDRLAHTHSVCMGYERAEDVPSFPTFHTIGWWKAPIV